MRAGSGRDDGRLIYAALSPDSRTLVTGSADERLTFWNIFPPLPNRRPKIGLDTLASAPTIR